MNTDEIELTDEERLAMLNKFVRQAIKTINRQTEDEGRAARRWKVLLAVETKGEIKRLRNEVFARGTEENAVADEMLRAVRKISEMVRDDDYEFVDPIETYKA